MLHVSDESIFWILFLLLLFYKEAGYAFVENKLKTTKNQHKSPGQKAGIFFMSLRISIQGYEGSFHQEAARKYFGKDIEVIPCNTFKELVSVAINKNISEGGIMAIENSIAGSILSNYNLLHKSNLKITGEIYLQIRQHLLVNPGVKITEIKEVHSHTMAIQQCDDFLGKHNWKLVETDDTALSARLIHQHKSKHVAAIASRLAAKLYDLQIAAANIQTLKNNYTRFLVLQTEDQASVPASANKASLSFRTDHSKGSLAKVLTKIANGGINLSKLQSFPIPGTDFKYNFHADMEFESVSQFNSVIKQIEKLTQKIKIYGIYKKGKWK